MNDSRLQRRIPYLDILRVIACLLVILIHTPIRQYEAYYNTPSIANAIYTVLVAVNCNLFFMITGTLLLPVTMPGKRFLRRRLRVVLFPLVVWTVVYLLEHAFLLHNFTPRLLTSILFHPVEGLLWYVYVLLVIYVTLPLVSKCIDAIGKRGVEIVLVLWVLSSFIPYQHGVFMEASQYSHNMFGAFANYYGYVLLGYYLHQYGVPVFTRQHGWKWAFLLLFGIVAMPLFEFLVQGRFGITWQQHIDTITNDISVNNIAMATLIFVVVQRFAPKRYDAKAHPAAATWWPLLSRCTFGIYLSQMIILRQVVWPLTRSGLGTAPIVVDCLVSGLLAFLVCLFLTLLLRLLPFRKYIVGR
ncbi:MAG: acyltransferase family protein [Muribaculaceae bacterium]|nr:acyltransferase family protein [Muribaculaceae bacterium]